MALTLGKRKMQPFLSFYHFVLAGLAGLQFLRWLVACHLWLSSRILAQEESPSSQGSRISLRDLLVKFRDTGQKDEVTIPYITTLTLTTARARHLGTAHET